MNKRKLIDSVSDRLEIPRDVIGNVPRITITGNGVIHIEGFLGIFQYDEQKTVIKVADGMVSVSGENIKISEITEEFIVLKGEIKTIEFM